jgi:EmrB/QacA subfamily drug resistance transporter
MTDGNPTTTATIDPKALGSKRWWALAAIALGVSLVIMDATVVNVSLPVIIGDINLSSTQAEWINAVYSLVFASLLLVSGRASDIWGRRRFLISGVVIFMIASILAGAAGSGATLISARLLQGIGAAFLLPATLSSLNAIFVGRERAIAFAVWGSTIGGMAAMGPLVGGWLTTNATWRWAFWMNIPLGLIVVALAWWAVPESRDGTTSRSLDIGGAVLSAAGLGTLVFGLIEGESYGWWTRADGSVSPIPFAIGAGIAIIVIFIVRLERRGAAGKTVLVDLGLFRIPTFRYGAIAALVVAMGEFGLLFTLPLVLQNALGYSALGTGALVAALAAGTFFSSGMTPQLTRRLGARAIVRVGLAAEAIAIGGLAVTVSSGVSGLTVASFLFLYGFGVGLATAQLTSVILADVPVEESGQASGLQSTVRQLGSSLGVAVLGTLLIVSLGHITDRNLANAGVSSGQSAPITAAVRDSLGAAIPPLVANAVTAQQGAAASDAMITATRITTGVASGILLIGLAATLALPRERAGEGRARAGGTYDRDTDDVDGDGEDAGDPDAGGADGGGPATGN